MTAAHEEVSSRTETRCITAVRRAVVDSYPAVDAEHILEIARGLGLDRFPDALFLDGSIEDGGPEGAAASLAVALGDTAGGRVDPHPLFSTAYYGLCHPDVESAGLPAWIHFHKFGVAEGLSPHFLLDVDYLGRSDGTVPFHERIDHYLTDRGRWFRAPSPYVDIERFVLSGRWSRARHPLVEVVTRRPEWVNQRLVIVDSNWGDGGRAVLNAAGFLIQVTQRGSVPLELERFAREGDPISSDESATRDWTIVPGFFLGADSKEWTVLSTEVLAPDRSVVRLQDSVVAAWTGARAKGGRLVVGTSDLSRASVDRLLAGSRVTDVIAPWSAAQEDVLRILSRSLPAAPAILGWGAQTRVADAELLQWSDEPLDAEDWDGSGEADGAGLVFVQTTVEARERREIEQWLRRGAQLCLVGDQGIGPWIPVIERARLVVAHRGLVSAARHVAPDERIRVRRNGGAR